MRAGGRTRLLSVRHRPGRTTGQPPQCPRQRAGTVAPEIQRSSRARRLRDNDVRARSARSRSVGRLWYEPSYLRSCIYFTTPGGNERREDTVIAHQKKPLRRSATAGIMHYDARSLSCQADRAHRPCAAGIVIEIPCQRGHWSCYERAVYPERIIGLSQGRSEISRAEASLAHHGAADYGSTGNRSRGGGIEHAVGLDGEDETVPRRQRTADERRVGK